MHGVLVVYDFALLPMLSTCDLPDVQPLPDQRELCIKKALKLAMVLMVVPNKPYPYPPRSYEIG